MKNIPKKKSKPRRRKTVEFDADKILINKRTIFLHEAVDEESSLRLIKNIFALDIRKVAPIYFYCNSGGGSCMDGMGIIHAMRTVKSKVITIINTEVCSMGGHISVAGNERRIDKNGVWMAHDMSGGIGNDYSMKTKYRALFQEEYYKKILEGNLKTYTKLSQKQLDLARAGELWLLADDCIKYGIADKIV